jgi:hypothetical protein
VSVIDDSGIDVASDDSEPWAAAMREMLAGEVSFEPPPNTLRRAAAAICVILGLIAVGILLLLVGSALGSGAGGGCGGG